MNHSSRDLFLTSNRRHNLHRTHAIADQLRMQPPIQEPPGPTVSSGRNCLLRLLLLISAISVLALSGCATRTPIFRHSKFETIEPHAISIAVADVRGNKAIQSDLASAPETAERVLKSKKYAATIMRPRPADDQPSNDTTLTNRSSEIALWLQRNSIGYNRWILVLAVEDLQKWWAVGPYASAKIHGYLFDAETWDLLWEDEAAKDMGAGLFFAGMVHSIALGATTEKLLETLPKRTTTN